MPLETILIIILVLLSVLLIGVLVLRPEITATRGGKIMAFLVLFALPLLCMGMGASSKLENSKSTRFCLSCHIMQPYGKSLRLDDSQHLAAAHFQNHRVPADEACYTCHTNYAMFGGIKAKLGGLRHIYVYYPMPVRVPLRKAPYMPQIRTYCPRSKQTKCRAFRAAATLSSTKWAA